MKRVASRKRCLNCEGEIVVEKKPNVSVSHILKIKKYCCTKCALDYQRRGVSLKEWTKPLTCAWCDKEFVAGASLGRRPRKRMDKTTPNFCGRTCCRQYTQVRKAETNKRLNIEKKKQWLERIGTRTCKLDGCHNAISHDRPASTKYCSLSCRSAEHARRSKDKRHKEAVARWDKRCETCGDPIPAIREGTHTHSLHGKRVTKRVRIMTANVQKFCSEQCQNQSFKTKYRESDVYIRTLLSMSAAVGGYANGYDVNSGIPREFWSDDLVQAKKAEVRLGRALLQQQQQQKG